MLPVIYICQHEPTLHIIFSTILRNTFIFFYMLSVDMLLLGHIFFFIETIWKTIDRVLCFFYYKGNIFVILKPNQ